MENHLLAQHGRRAADQRLELLMYQQEQQLLMEQEENVPMDQVQGGQVLRVGLPVLFPLWPLNQIQMTNNIPTVHAHKSIEDKMIVELLKSNNPDDRKQLDSIAAYIAQINHHIFCSHLFKNGYNINVLNEKNQTMLHIAFYSYSHNVISTIMDSPSFNESSIDYTDFNGLSHLHIACAYGNVKLVKRYLRTESNVNAVFKFDALGKSSKFTPLHFAAQSQQRQVVKLLLKNGADVNLTDLKGSTPLHIVCSSVCSHRNINLDILRNLIADVSVNVNAKDNQGNTPILSLLVDRYNDDPFRCNFNIEEIEPKFDILINSGADVAERNKEGNTVLHLLIEKLKFSHNPRSFSSVCFDDARFVKLIKKVLDVNSHIVNLKNQLGETPLKLAVSFMSLDIVELLLKHKASLENLKIDCFYYPNVIPVFEPVQNLIAIIQLLSERGYTLTPEDNIHILTFLVHEACSCECEDYDYECCSRTKFDMILNFGSSRHVTHILRNFPIASSQYDNLFSYQLQFYSDLVRTGNIHVEKEVRGFFNGPSESFSMYVHTYEENKCKELKQLKSAVLENGIKLYNILTRDPHDITRQIKSSDFTPTFADNFPMFKNVVKGHITKTLIRSYVVTSTYEILKHKFFSSLPDLCCDVIIRFLSNLDILNMYAAAVCPPTILLKSEPYA